MKSNCNDLKQAREVVYSVYCQNARTVSQVSTLVARREESVLSFGLYLQRKTDQISRFHSADFEMILEGQRRESRSGPYNVITRKPTNSTSYSPLFARTALPIYVSGFQCLYVPEWVD
jgi:hypothetical protein